MYNNILLPIVFDHEDGTQKALRVARLLAGPSAKFTVMHVLETIPGYVRAQISEDLLDKRSHEMKQSLEKVAAELGGATAKLISGHAGQTIVNFANTNDIDCIILSSHIPTFSDLLIGSTANRVVHHAKCAVHVIR